MTNTFIASQPLIETNWRYATCTGAWLRKLSRVVGNNTFIPGFPPLSFGMTIVASFFGVMLLALESEWLEHVAGVDDDDSTSVSQFSLLAGISIYKTSF